MFMKYCRSFPSRNVDGTVSYNPSQRYDPRIYPKCGISGHFRIVERLGVDVVAGKYSYLELACH